ncbi:MAG: energy-coupling factor transporter transmembrane component T [Nitrospirales bacterium]|nr:energy-coupling factor transporter transmembrane component T [Nitrospirales bacterium]
MTTSLYLDRQTWVHRLDGRTKFLATLILFSLTIIFSDPRYLLFVATLIVMAVLVSQSFANVRKTWIFLTLLFAYSAILWPFFVVGQTPVLTFGSFIVTREGMVFSIGMGLRLDLMVISGLVLLSTTTVEDFAIALQRLGLPSAMGFAYSLAFRWVPTLLGAGATVVQAQRSRGLDLSAGTIGERIRRYPALAVPLIGHTLRQTTLLAMALESKGFGPDRRGRPNHTLGLGWPDYLVLFMLTMVLGVSLWLRLNGFGTVNVSF